MPYLFGRCDFSDFRGAGFGMNTDCPGWDILDVFPIRGRQGRTKDALPIRTVRFSDFRGASFGMIAGCPGWDILDVFSIRGRQGRAKDALPLWSYFRILEVQVLA